MISSRPTCRFSAIAIGLISGVLLCGATGAYLGLADWTQSYAEACEAASLLRQWDELGRISERWSRWNSNDPDAWWFRAQAAEGKHDWRKAAEFYAAIPFTGSRARRAGLKRTEILFSQLHRPREALAVCERMLEIDTHECDAQMWAMFIRAVTMRHQDLLRQIRQAHASNCGSRESVDYLMRADILSFANGYEIVSQCLRVTPNDEFCLVARAILIAMGPLPQNSGATVGNQTELAACLQRFPRNSELLNVYLDIASQDGDLERVGQLLEKFSADGQRDNRFWYYTAWRLSQLDELRLAEVALQTALELYPFDMRSQNLYSQVLRRLGKTTQAEHWSETANLGRDLKETLKKIPRASMIAAPLLERIASYAQASGDASLPRMIRGQLLN